VIRSLAAALLTAGWVFQAAAATAPVVQVTLHPGAALVERHARVEAGRQRVEIGCLPADFDLGSLRVEGEGVRIGDLTVQDVPAESAPECRPQPLDERVRALEDRRAAIDAELQANETVLAYLRQPLPPAAVGATPVAAAETLRRAAQEALLRKIPLERQLQALDRELVPLRADRDRTAGTPRRTLRFTADAAQAGMLLRIRYLVLRSAGWAPAYRARLDTARARVELERQAIVTQSSGEDWRGVRLTLSTADPRGAVAAPAPDLWRLSIAVPEAPAAVSRNLMAPAAELAQARSREADDLADPAVVQAVGATEFALAAPADLLHGAQKSTLVLERLELPVQLLVRSVPRREAQAYVTALAARPAGIWPRGPLQLQRDGTPTGTLPQWNPGEGREGWTLPFGRDERVRVEVQQLPEASGSAGFIGSRSERRYRWRYRVENRHAQPVQLELVEAPPVSTHEDIRVEARHEPPAAAWQADQPGVLAWRRELAPGSTASFEADYLVSWPKDARIRGLR
jgi:uncharacterized protein (TIGR02231 family)